MAAVLLAPVAPLRAQVSFGTIEEDPELVKAKIRQKVEDDYKEGMKAKAAGNVQRAVECFIRCAKTRCDTEYPELAFNELKTYHAQANQELEVARQLIAGEDPAAGLSELKRIVRVYLGLGPAKDAGVLMRQLESDPKFQATLRAGRLLDELKKAEALEAQAEARVSPAAAEPSTPAPATTPPTPTGTAPSLGPPATADTPGGSFLSLPTPNGMGAPPPTPTGTAGKAPTPVTMPAPSPAVKPEGVGLAAVRPKEMTEKERGQARLDKLMEAYDIYVRVVQQGGDTAPAKKAAEAKARLEKDTDLMTRIRDVQADRKAREYLSLADNYFKAARFDSAREFCRRILAECPGTPQAFQAQILLDRMK